MLTTVKRWIERNRLLDSGDRVVAACSGGPDSLALVHILHQLQPEYGLTLAVAHVNHMFRGDESDADAAYVAKFCAGLGLPLYETAIDVPRYIKSSGRSAQDASRILRFRYLRHVAAELGGAKIATGHHRDDQAETILLNLLRGAGSTGLAGMRPTGNGIIRPLLNMSRRDIDDYCRECGLSPRIDSSNLKTDYLRNYVRIELMPQLKHRINANLAETLCRTARLLGDEHDFITEYASNLWPSLASEEKAVIIIDCQRLISLHISLQREMFRMAIAKKQGNLKGITFFHVERLLELAMSGSVGSIIELPGDIIARKGYGTVALEAPSPEPLPTGIGPPGSELVVPGITEVPALGLTITAKLLAVRPEPGVADTAIFDWRELTPPLYVRTRQEGDRFWPSAAPGSKKLKEYFIDAKIPRQIRDRLPIFCDSRGIIWVGGYRQAERSRPVGNTETYLQLSIKHRGMNCD